MKKERKKSINREFIYYYSLRSDFAWSIMKCLHSRWNSTFTVCIPGEDPLLLFWWMSEHFPRSTSSSIQDAMDSNFEIGDGGKVKHSSRENKTMAKKWDWVESNVWWMSYYSHCLYVLYKLHHQYSLYRIDMIWCLSIGPAAAGAIRTTGTVRIVWWGWG